MGVVISGGAPSGDPNAGRILLLEEQFYSLQFFGGAATPPRNLLLGAQCAGGPLAHIFGNNAVPGGSSFSMIAGRTILQIVSGGVIAARIGNGGENACAPLSQQFNGANALGTPILLNRPFRQYKITLPLRNTVAGTAVLEFGFVTGSGMITLSGTPPGAVWSSNPAVSGGQWLPRYRQVAGGVITDGAGTGVSPTAWHTLGLRYTEGAVPAIDWLLDDVLLRTVSGDAAMPTFPGGVLFPGWAPAYAIGLPAGSTWQFGAGRYEVREI